MILCLMNARTLREYSEFVARLRRYVKRGAAIEEAVERAVTECIEEGILSDFLRSQRAEVIAVSIFEYNEEEEKRKLRKAEYEAGMAEGVMKTKKETVISLAEMGLSVQQIAQGVKVEEKTVYKWLNEKKNMKTTY